MAKAFMCALIELYRRSLATQRSLLLARLRTRIGLRSRFPDIRVC